MDNEVKKDNGKAIAFGTILILSVLMLPMLIAIFIARFLNTLRVKRVKREGGKRRNLIIFISFAIFIAVSFLLLYFLGAKSSVDNIDWYYPFIPVATEVIAIIQIIQGNVDIATTLLFVLWSSLPVSFAIFGLIVLIRENVKASYTKDIETFNGKLNRDEVSVDPSKLTLFRTIMFFICSIDPKGLKGRHLTPKEWEKTRKTSVMLDDNYGIPVKSLKTHLAIIGTTGSGKTETMYKFIRDAIRREKPVIFVDGKGDKGNIFRLRKMAKDEGRNFVCFALNSAEITSEDGKETIKPSAYNPFASTNPGIMVDGIMALFEYSEEHYKAGARVYMDVMIQTLLALDIKISWEVMMEHLNIFRLKDRLKERYNIGGETKDGEKEEGDGGSFGGAGSSSTPEQKQKEQAYNIDLGQITSIDEKAVSGFTSRMGMFYNSTKDTIKGDGFELKEILEKNTVAIFSLNSLDYPEQATAIGKLILNNVKASAEINSGLNKQTLIALDEFNVFADENIIDILNKTRSKGMEVILAFQSISDLSNISEDFKNQVIENTNNKIIHATNDPDGAEYLSKVLGTHKKIKKTFAEESDGLTGGTSTRVVDEFSAHPNMLKTLKQGECFAKYIQEDGSKITTPLIKVQLYLDK